MCSSFESVLVEHQGSFSASSVQLVYLMPFQMKGKTHLGRARDRPPENLIFLNLESQGLNPTVSQRPKSSERALKM